MRNSKWLDMNNLFNNCYVLMYYMLNNKYFVYRITNKLKIDNILKYFIEKHIINLEL